VLVITHDLTALHDFDRVLRLRGGALTISAGLAQGFEAA
jgi:ABC-type transport system involved in cytochrome bd biosynthesis fused ATPase/permease subunit